MGIGDWGLGIGPNPQSPIPNPQSPIPILIIKIYPVKLLINKKNYILIKIKKKLKKKINKTNENNLLILTIK